jgi:predicted TIM-barrel fold metal-dependent hydrolase
MQIERLILFMGSPFLIDPTPEQFREQNDQVLTAISHWHHRAFGFVYLSPAHEKESLAELDRCVQDGPMVGIKLWVARRCNVESVDSIVRRAIELKAIIYQHTWLKTTGNLEGESTPADLVALAKRHPEASIICGHTGGNWELGIRTVRDQANVSVDLGGGDPTAGIVEMAVRELGASRVLYGSDVAGRSISSQLGKVTSAQISAEEKQQILGVNLRRLMTPILNAKGVRL